MKRSEINAILKDAEQFVQTCGFNLPPFAYWKPEEWKQVGPEAAEIARHKLGWDVTDFNMGNYERDGLTLFTLRNGTPANWKTGKGKLYAEKILLVGVDQVTPMHFHWKKMEDIINRSGGKLMIELYNSTPDEGLDHENPVTVVCDGVERRLPPGGQVILSPGESITLPQYCYHRFWGAESRVLVGEVSLVNDDDSDNCFYKPLPRFPSIVEDEPPYYLLVNDYPQYYRY